ncbi:ferric reductase [Ruegeria sp. HKCCD8929]|uniref:ferric reductase n=1 Tax=Ruegeria sp. HKCCD8929 TaxID=2683006 RepID=UPI0014888C1A|nr:ferric reductase [Ruegeria sp. HKCCD8929]
MRTEKSPVRALLPWIGLTVAVLTPLALASMSPLLQWRGPVYIASGFAGILAMGLMLVQPVLVAGYLPRLGPIIGRRVHRYVGGCLVLAVVAHVAGLWITSPPDVIDVLLFRSPTPFSVWGALAMWALFAAAGLAVLRMRVRVPLRLWRRGHVTLTLVAVGGTIAHVLLIEGTMETVSKVALSVLLGVIVAKAVRDLKIWSLRR